MLYGAIYRKEPYHFKDIVFQFNVATIVCNVKIKKTINQSVLYMEQIHHVMNIKYMQNIHLSNCEITQSVLGNWVTGVSSCPGFSPKKDYLELPKEPINL